MSSTAFSYAQAAKGQASTQPNPQPVPSPAPPSISSQGKDDITTTSTDSVSTPSITSNESDVRDSCKAPQLDGDSGAAKRDSDGVTNKQPMPHSTAENASHARITGESGSVDSAQHSSRGSGQTSRATEGDVKKNRKSKKAKDADKEAGADKEQEEAEAEKPQPVTLSEALPPKVNVWQQRKEAQAAKSRPVTISGSASTTEEADGPSEELKSQDVVEGTETALASQNSAGTEMPQKKSIDTPRTTSDQAPRRNGPRGARTAESLPSVSDTNLWPDPKSAAASEEGKRKPQDKVDRPEKEGQDETGAGKRQKEKWVAMPYVPTVNFQTPINLKGPKPRGGTRGGRDAGARGAHSSAPASGSSPATSPATDKAPSTAGATSTKEGRPREGSTTARAASPPSNATKRASADASHTRDSRKAAAGSGSERSRELAIDSSASGTGKAENVRSSRVEAAQSNRTGVKGFDSAKEGTAPSTKEQIYPHRERGEGRSERGRGGFRGRGGHNGLGYSPSGQYPPQGPAGQQHAPYSPPGQQNAFGNGFASGSGRGGGRGNGRASSGSAAYPRGTSTGAGQATKMGHVNSSLGGLDYHHMHTYSPYPYPQTFYDHSTIQLLVIQVEYYLSVDNLCKDFFIRKRMDSKGFVLLNVITNFNRMRDLAPDMEAIRFACEQSEKIDYIIGDDNKERLRLRDRWDRFVLSPEEREEEARNDGPSHWTWKSRHSRPQYQSMVLPSYMPTSPTAFPPNLPTEEQMYQPSYANGSHYEPATVNGIESNGHGHAADTQLSATVPEFSPGGPGPFTLESVTTFSDKQVEDLNVLVDYGKKEPSNRESQAREPESVNGTGAEVNGSTAYPEAVPSDAVQEQDDAHGSRSPDSPQPHVIWAKKEKGKASGAEQEPYPVFRKKALDQRQLAKPGETPRAMKSLYEFWSHFLVGRFNAKMYEEFRRCAFEDASGEAPSKDGLKYLVRYYKTLFGHDSPKPWGNERPVPEIFTLHYHGALMLDPKLSTNGDAGI